MTHIFIGKFLLGQIVATPGVMKAKVISENDRISSLTRHYNGDWGEVCAEDWTSNNRGWLSIVSDSSRKLD